MGRPEVRRLIFLMGMGWWVVYVFLKLIGMGRPEGRRLIFLMEMGWWVAYVFLK